MAPRKTGKATISALMGDMSEDELGYTHAASIMTVPAKPVATKTRGRPAREKAVEPKAAKPAAKSKNAKSAPTVTRRAKRTALEDVTNVGEGVDQEENLEPPKKRVKASTTSTTAKKPAVAGRKKQIEKQQAVEVPATQDATDITIQTEPTELSAVEEQAETGASLEALDPEPVAPITRATGRGRYASRSRKTETIVPHNRAGASVSNVDKNASDAALRRRLGEITTRYDTLEVRFNNLKDVATVEAQSNFDKLKAASDRQAKTQDDLIASLRGQIAGQKDLVTSNRALQAQLAAAQAENERSAAANKTISAEMKTLKESNTKSQNDIKALHAKLASSRAVSEPAQNGKAANMKNSSMQNSAAAQIMSLKEDLYCDITGLIIHSVKRLGTKYMYDCSQTGRNGTLRFNIAIEDQPAVTPGASVIDEPQITYTPLIDEKNDRNLLDILDEYLLEEIEFPSSSMQKLYTKIRDGMMRPVVVVDENSGSEDEE